MVPPSVFCVLTVLACRTSRFMDGRRCRASIGIRSGSTSAFVSISILPNVCNSNSGLALSMFSYEASCDGCGLVIRKVLFY